MYLKIKIRTGNSWKSTGFLFLWFVRHPELSEEAKTSWTIDVVNSCFYYWIWRGNHRLPIICHGLWYHLMTGKDQNGRWQPGRGILFRHYQDNTLVYCSWLTINFSGREEWPLTGSL